MGNCCSCCAGKKNQKKQGSSESDEGAAAASSARRSTTVSKSQEQTMTDEFMLLTPPSERKSAGQATSVKSEQKNDSLDSQACPFVIEPLPKDFVVNSVWKVVNEIGMGAFGHVYKVTDIRTSGINFFALKVKAEPFSTLVREIMVDFKNIGHFAQFFDIGTFRYPASSQNRYHYLTTSLLGPTLADLIRCRSVRHFRYFSDWTLALILKQLLEVLRAMHTKGYSHQDLKLENLAFGCYDTKRRLFLIDLDQCTKSPQNTVPPAIKGKSLSELKLSPKVLACQWENFGKDFCDLKMILRTIRTPRTALRLMRQNNFLQKNAKIDRKIRKLVIIATHDKVDKIMTLIFSVLDQVKSVGIYETYSKLEESTKDLCKLLKLDDNCPLDWEPGGVFYNTFDKLRLKTMEIDLLESDAVQHIESPEGMSYNTSKLKDNHRAPFNKFEAPLYPIPFTKLIFKFNKRACYAESNRVQETKQKKIPKFKRSSKPNKENKRISCYMDTQQELSKINNVYSSDIWSSESNSSKTPLFEQRQMPYRAKVEMSDLDQARKVVFIHGSLTKT